MHWFTVMAISGGLIGSRIPVFPDQHSLYLLFASSLIALAYRRLLWVAGLAFGIAVSLLNIQHHLSDRLDESLSNRELVISGCVTGLPLNDSSRSRFEFAPDDPDLPSLIRLSARGQAVTTGEFLEVVVQLKPPDGLSNPGLFDFDAWLLAQGIGATGYVKEIGSRKSSACRYSFDQIRSAVRQRVLQVVPDRPERELILALMVGDSGAMNPTTWQILSATGTNHLLIISGLHLGLIASMVVMMCRRLPTRYRSLGLCLSALGVTLYALIAGFGIPVQRALVMTLVALVAIGYYRGMSVWRGYLIALLIVTLSHPMSTFFPGYWLSFSAVASLLLLAKSWQGLNSRMGYVLEYFRAQVAVTLATMPMLLLWVGQFSLLSLPVNLVAVPIVSLGIVPLTMLVGCTMFLSEDVAITGLMFLSFCLHEFYLGLAAVAERSVVIREVPDIWAVLAGLFGYLLMSSPGNIVRPWLAGPLLVSVLNQAPIPEKFRLQILDVGQGLSVLVQLGHRLLVYDLGAAYPGGFDIGREIVAPSVRRWGFSYVDWLVISHGDLDHAGGRAGFLSQIPVIHERASEPGNTCRTERLSWQPDVSVIIDGIPDTRAATSTNSLSCVVTIMARGVRIVIPGDIDVDTEKALMANLPSNVDILIVPHHGSMTSSSPAFLNHLMPRYGVFSVGKMNRFNHPNPMVVSRYEARGTMLFSTAREGSITFEWTDGAIRVVNHQRMNRRLWYDDGPSE